MITTLPLIAKDTPAARVNELATASLARVSPVQVELLFSVTVPVVTVITLKPVTLVPPIVLADPVNVVEPGVMAVALLFVQLPPRVIVEDEALKLPELVRKSPVIDNEALPPVTEVPAWVKFPETEMVLLFNASDPPFNVIFPLTVKL